MQVTPSPEDIASPSVAAPAVPAPAPGPVEATAPAGAVEATAPTGAVEATAPPVQASAQTGVPAEPSAAMPAAPGTPSIFAPILVEDSSFPVSQPDRPVSDVRRWMAPGSFWTSTTSGPVPAEAPLADTMPDVEAARFRQTAKYIFRPRSP